MGQMDARPGPASEMVLDPVGKMMGIHHGLLDADFVKRAVRGESEPRLPSGSSASIARRSPGSRPAAARAGKRSPTSSRRSYAYGRLPGFACGRRIEGVVDLPRAYSDGAAEIAGERLARAGIHLAAVLRAAL